MAFWEASRCLLPSSGVAFPSYRRSLWVHGDTPLQFDAARQLLQAIRAERPHVRLVLTSARPATLRYLRSSFLDDQTWPAPWNSEPVLGRFFHKLQVRHLLLLDGGQSLPSKAIEVAVSRQISVSAVNIGQPDAVDGTLLQAARLRPDLVRVCVFDESVFRGLQRRGLPPGSISVTGSLDLEETRGAVWPSETASRRLLHLPEDALVVAAIDVPSEEERLILDSFAEARQQWPKLRLLFEPRSGAARKRLIREIASRNWIVAKGAADWDVWLPAAAGQLSPLLPVTHAVIVGGTFSSHAQGGCVAASIAAGAIAVVGPRREFSGVPWPFLKSSPLVYPVPSRNLGAALVAVLQNSSPRKSASPASIGDATTRTLAALSPMLPESPEMPVVAQDWKVPTLRDRAGASRVWRVVSPVFTKRRIDSWEEMQRVLQYPRSILCLGNGPTSEDPLLEDVPHDCLMRVNWRWRERGFLVHPRIVFVGDPATVTKVPNAVFGFWNTDLERGMLLRHLITRGPVLMTYLTMERIAAVIRDQTWPARPSNGALMIAAAVALQPERLTIAGVDLYLHPDGRYPGDALGNNQYAAVHTRDTDLAIIRSSLAQYRGELVISSDQLGDALYAPEKAFRASR